MPRDVDGPNMTDLRGRRLRRIAVIAGITLAVLIVLAVSIYVGAFVILSPMMGNHANAPLPALIMV
jgi:putative Ca2+/H+ antiporter (TMEM165/GDT1 family)